MHLQNISSWWVSWTVIEFPLISSSFEPWHIKNSWWWEGSGMYLTQLTVTFPASNWVILKEFKGLRLSWFDVEGPRYHLIFAGGLEPQTLHDTKYVLPTVKGCSGPWILAPCGGTKIKRLRMNYILWHTRWDKLKQSIRFLLAMENHTYTAFSVWHCFQQVW